MIFDCLESIGSIQVLAASHKPNFQVGKIDQLDLDFITQRRLAD
jgi:hypothetical protein